MSNNFKSVKPIKPQSFLDSVAGSGKGYVTLSYTQDPKTKFLKSESYPAVDSALILDRATALSKTAQVYFGINRRSRALALGERGGNADISNISMIGMDIDVSDPRDPDQGLPQSQEEALELLEAFSLKPTYTISSGLGIHAYWVLCEEIEITSEIERANAQNFIRDFYRGFAEYAKPFKFDSTHDLSRMLRFPGSWNFKDANNPKQVEFLSQNPERIYSIADIKAVSVAKSPVVAKQTLQGKQGQMSLEKVRKGCSWVNNALVNPQSVKYPEWFAMASILSFAEDGRARFHEWSKEHPNYDVAETDALLDQVDPEKAKRTCEAIASSLHGESHCGHCPFRGGIQSPVDLGLPGKRYIVGNSGSLPSKTAQAWAAIYVANDPARIFTNRAGILRINPSEVNWDVLNARSARHVFSRNGDWVRSTKGELVPSNPEQVVIEDLLETVNPPLPDLKKVTAIPVITAEGRLVTEFGYDEESQIYRVRSVDLAGRDFAAGSKFKTPQEAADFIFEECLVDFPFETKQDRAHALALMLHDFARNLFDGPSPFFLIDKPIHGTGATILAGILCLPSFGRIVPNKNFSNSEEEVRKQITSHLMSGGGPYLYDNLPDNKRIDSDVLASVVTGKTYSDRALGTNTDVKLHNLGPWIGTGNNIDFAGQLRRRVLRIRLVSDNPTPYLRTGFRHEDIKKWAADNRADLVDACLTLVMAWINAGRPAWGGQPLGSFENFSKVMGGILKHAGVEGFMTNMDFQQDSGDSEEGQFRDLIQEWWNVKQNANLKVTEIVSLAELADLDIQNTWFDLNQKTKVSKAGKQIRKILDRTYLVETPQGPIRVQLIAGGVKSTYRLKEKSGG